MPALDVSEITTEECTLRLSRRLRQVVGPGRVWSYAGVARLTGIDVRTLKAYVAGTACPNLTKWHRLLAVLGPTITSDLQLMLGWTPRSGLRLPPGAVDLEAVAAELRNALRVIDTELARGAPAGEPAREPKAAPRRPVRRRSSVPAAASR